MSAKTVLEQIKAIAENAGGIATIHKNKDGSIDAEIVMTSSGRTFGELFNEIDESAKSTKLSGAFVQGIFDWDVSKKEMANFASKTQYHTLNRGRTRRLPTAYFRGNAVHHAIAQFRTLSHRIRENKIRKPDYFILRFHWNKNGNRPK